MALCPLYPDILQSLARRLRARHRSLEPAMVVRIHPGQLREPDASASRRCLVAKGSFRPFWCSTPTFLAAGNARGLASLGEPGGFRAI